MSVALISAGVLVYLVLCFVVSKRSKHVITMMVVAPLDVFTMICDVFYDLPYHVFAAGRGCIEVVRRHGVDSLLLMGVCVRACALWCWNVSKGACIGAVAGVRGRDVYSVDHRDIAIVGGDVTVDGGDDDNNIRHQELCNLIDRPCPPLGS